MTYLRMPKSTGFTMFLVLLVMILVHPGVAGQMLTASNAVEREMGETAKEKLIATYGGEARLPLHEQLWLDEIFQRLTKAVDNSSIPYSLTVLNSNEINAFALPGGHIFVTLGMLCLLGHDEHRLASVLGHEIVHVEKRHGINAAFRQMGLTVLLELGKIWMDVPGSEMAQVASMALVDVVQSGYSREAEYEADILGQEYAVLAGFDPIGGVHMLMDLLAVQDYDLPMRIFRSHPDTINRIERLVQAAASYWKYEEIIDPTDQDIPGVGADPLGRFLITSVEDAYGRWVLQGIDQQTGNRISWLSNVEARNPVWSPTGQLMVVEARETEHWELWLVNRLGQVIDRWSHDPLGDQVNPVFSPDGSQIAYNLIINGTSQIWIGYPEDAGRLWLITNLHGDILSWNHTGLMVAQDNSRHYLVQPPLIRPISYQNPIPQIIERKDRIAPIIIRETDSITIRRPNVINLP